MPGRTGDGTGLRCASLKTAVGPVLSYKGQCRPFCVSYGQKGPKLWIFAVFRCIIIYHHKADPPLKGRAAMADIFDILGPIMVGPSSSHTAGAVRIGSMARTLLGERVVGADIRLHGSFAETGHGHGTDRALLAGLLGMGPADLRIPFAFEEAEKAGLRYSFDEVELVDAHPNSAVLDILGESGRRLCLRASSTGGGRIMIDELDGIEVAFDGSFNTLVIHHRDEFGAIAEISRLLSNYRINIANMRLSRHRRGGDALMIIETDQTVEQKIIDWIREFHGVEKITYYDKNKEAENEA